MPPPPGPGRAPCARTATAAQTAAGLPAGTGRPATDGAAGPGPPEHHAPGQIGLATRPHSSPLMKLPTRPAARPVGTQGATKSATCRPMPAARVGKPEHRHNHAQHAAVKTHAALPHRKHLQRMASVIAGLVEQAIADPPTQHHTQHAQEQDVFHILAFSRLPGPDPGKWRMAQAQAPQPAEQAEGGQIGQAVPVNGQGADLQGDRVYFRVNQHGGIVLARRVRRILAAHGNVLYRHKPLRFLHPGPALVDPEHCRNTQMSAE